MYIDALVETSNLTCCSNSNSIHWNVKSVTQSPHNSKSTQARASPQPSDSEATIRKSLRTLIPGIFGSSFKYLHSFSKGWLTRDNLVIKIVRNEVKSTVGIWRLCAPISLLVTFYILLIISDKSPPEHQTLWEFFGLAIFLIFQNIFHCI